MITLTVLVLLILNVSNATATELNSDVQSIQQVIKNLEKKGHKLAGQETIDDSPKFVFMSFSMPESALNALIKQAKAEKFIPVLRGFKDGSYKKPQRL